MATKLANQLRVGDIIELDNRKYQLTTVTINYGGLGDYVNLELFDLARERWILPSSFNPEDKFTIIKKGK